MKKQISFLIIISLFFSVLNNANTVSAAEAVMSGFNPNKLIDDKVFSNEDTMSASDIQKFLESKNSVLANTSNAFVSQLREPVNNQALKEKLEDPNAAKTTNRTAAELIYDAAQSSGLNPQVILVTLNKEQSLITGRQNATAEQLQRALDFSMGFGCPDSQPCGEIYKGFYFQLFGGVDAEGNRYLGAAKSLMKSFETPGGRGPYFNGTTSKVGDAITLGNTLGGYEGVMPQQSIVLSNAATAALYRYTPHVFNGNYNFWRFFKTWFGSSTAGDDDDDDKDAIKNGDLIKTSSTGDVWIIENGRRYVVYPWAAKLRNVNLKKADRVSKRKLEAYTDAGGYPVPDNTLIQVGDDYFVFVANERRLITADGIKSMGLDINGAIEVENKQARSYKQGPNFAPVVNVPQTPTAPNPPSTPTPPTSNPQDGAVLKAATQPAVYLVSGGKLKLFTYATFLQYEAAKTLQVVPESTINGYSKDGLVLPKPGSLVKVFNSPTVYLYEDGKKKPMDGEIFRNRGFALASVFELTQTEIDALPLGPFPQPVNETYFKDKKTGDFYVYRDGKKSKISTFVAYQRKMTPDFTFGEDSINNMPDGVPILPREGTVIKGEKNPDVFVINANLAFPLTYQAFVARGYGDKVNLLPQAEVDSYPKGSLLTK